MVTKAGKRMRMASPKELNENIMLRVLQVCQASLSQQRHINLAIDGTRLAKKDVNFVAVGARSDDDEFRIGWAPIQASFLEIKSLRVASCV